MPSVLLVSMPFGNPKMPSLALSLLKAGLRSRGVETQIAYHNLEFAKRVGLKIFKWLSLVDPLMLGEWVFSQLIHTKSDAKEAHNKTLLKFLSAYRFQSQYAWSPMANRLADFELTLENLPDKLFRMRDEAKRFVDSCVDHVASIRPRVLGFTTLFSQTCASLAVARGVKERLGEEAPTVIFGGSNCEGIMGWTMLRAFHWIDYVCCGEGDAALVEFVSRFLGGDLHPKVQGIVGRTESGVYDFSSPSPIRDMDSLPFPDFDEYFNTLHALGMENLLSPLIPVETARGCWWGEKSHCTFCGSNGLAMTYRSKTPNRILMELDYLAEKYGSYARILTLFRVVDEILNLSFFRLVPELIRRNMICGFFLETKANLKREDVGLLKDVGVLGINPGIESLSDEVLRLMRKGVTGLQNVFLLKICLEVGIGVLWNWLWGFPGEKPSEYERITRWIPLLHHLQPPKGLGCIVLDRFSPLFESQSSFGLRNVRASLPYRLIYDLDDETLYQLARHFDFEYEDARDPRDYTAGLANELLSWRKAWSASAGPPVLSMLDMQRCVAIHDTRSCASESSVTLTGPEADIYRWLRNVREYSVLVKLFTDKGFKANDISQAMASLERKKLILLDSRRCLALAAEATPPTRRIN